MNNQNKPDLQISKQLEADRLAGEDLEFLNNLPQFQRLIIDGYIMDTLVHKSPDMIDMNPAVRQSTMEEIMAVNYLRRHLDGVVNAADLVRAGE